MKLACPECGNDKRFLVKTLQLHMLHVEEAGLEVADDGWPAVLEVLCDECETSVDLQGVDPVRRREVLLSLGARS